MQHDIHKRVLTNFEVAWNPNGLDKALQSAPLPFLKFCFSSCNDLLSVAIFLCPRLDGKILTILAQSVLVKLTIVVRDMIAHIVLQIKAHSITWHTWHCHINIDFELILCMTCLDGNLRGCRRFKESVYL